MPLQQILPTWLAWNNANFQTPSGITDLRTGQDFPAGGLNLGDYFDATEKEANACSALNVGLLHSGRYRLVQVDSGATAANVKTGTIGYAAQGKYVQGANVANPGTGGTPGTYNIPATPGSGGGSGAVIQVVVGASGTVVNVSVLQGGNNYYVPPTFPLTGIAGLTGAVLNVQLNTTPNIVTSVDVTINLPNSFGPLAVGNRPVIFLNSITPGNYGFIQELGVATVLIGGGGNYPPGCTVYPDISNNGQASLLNNSILIGAIGVNADFVLAQSQPTLCKFYMQFVPIVQD